MTLEAEISPTVPADATAAPSGRHSRRALVALGAVVVVVLILLSLMLAGLIPGFHLALGSGSKSPRQFQVYFNETGLPPGITWSVTFDGTHTSSLSATIPFEEANGTYAYSIPELRGFESNVSAGSVMVKGANVSITIAFAASLTALLTPSPTTTQVNEASVLALDLTGGFAPVAWTLTENGSAANLTGVTGGHYRFTPSAAATYTFYLNATDSIGETTGTTATVTVEPALAASLTATLTSVTVDNTTNLTVSFSGGVPPVSWTLEVNGSSANLSGVVGGIYSFTPVAVGEYTFYLNATDSVGSVFRVTLGISCGSGSSPYALGMANLGETVPAASTYWVTLALSPTSGLKTGLFGLTITDASSTSVPSAAPPSSCAVGAVFSVSHCAAAVADSSAWYAVLVYGNGTVANVYGSGSWTGLSVAVTGADTLVVVSGASLSGIGDVLAAFATGSASVSGSVDL